MKKVGIILLSIVLALSAIACGTQEEVPAANQWEEIKNRGTIRIGMEGTWAPWTYHNDQDELVGYDVEVGKLIAEELGVAVEYQEAEWSGLFVGLDTGRYDIIINGIDLTEERAKKYSFSDPYGYIGTAIIVREDYDEIKTFADLKGKKTCNSLNSTYMQIAEENGATVEGVEALEETLNMVLASRVDATLNAEVSFFDYMAVHPDAKLKIAAVSEEKSHVCIPVRKDEKSELLREKINAAIKALKENGELERLSQKYFGKDITKE